MNEPTPAAPKPGTSAIPAAAAPAPKIVAPVVPAHGPIPVPGLSRSRPEANSRFMAPKNAARPHFSPGAMRQQMHGRQGK